jgi:hypothetical protein
MNAHKLYCLEKYQEPHSQRAVRFELLTAVTDDFGLLVCDSCNVVASYTRSGGTPEEGKIWLCGFLDRWMKGSAPNGRNILRI